MCGIAGIINRNPNLEDMDRMLRVMRHRGPEGTFYARKDTNKLKAILGFLSLAFTDLAGGAQPHFNEDKTIISVCNGEFYDFKQIREDLTKKGHRFFTKSDSEIAIHLYEEYGLDMFKHLNGEFAFAIYDSNKEMLIMCRDRFGVKPLFYNLDDGIRFASECKSLLSIMKYRELNPMYFNGPGFGSTENSITPFTGIHSVRPGHYTIWNNNTLSHHCYWKPDFTVNEDITYEEAQIELKRLAMQALERRIDTDIPISTSLSGGLDSTIVTGMAKKYFGRNFNAVTLGYKDENFTESPIAQKTADTFGVNLDRVELDSNNLIELYLEGHFHSESIIKDFSGSARLQLNKRVKATGHKAVLSGEGCDELLGGYAYFRLNKIRSEFLKNPNSIELKNAYQLFLKDEKKSEGLLWEKSNYWKKQEHRLGDPILYSILLEKADGIRSKILSRDVLTKINGHSLWESADSEFGIENLKSQTSFNKSRLISRSYFANFIAPTLGDRMEMASCLEGRAPFLDRDILNFCYSLPEEFCFRPDTFQGKRIMYDTFKDIIPDHFASIGKQPFRSPTNYSILKAEGGDDLYNKLLSRKSIKENNIFNPNTLGAIKLAWKLSPQSSSTFRKIDMNIGYFMSVQALKYIFIDHFDQFINLNELQYPMIERKWYFIK